MEKRENIEIYPPSQKTLVVRLEMNVLSSASADFSTIEEGGEDTMDVSPWSFIF